MEQSPFPSPEAANYMVMQAEAVAAVEQDVVPLAQPFLNGREIELVSEVIRSGRLSLGPMLTRFETMFAEFVGTKHAVAVSSGTAGLHVAAITAGWGPGDEVITSPFTFVSSANIARYTGANVTFADIDPDTLNMDPAAVEAAVTDKTRGIVPVDIFGYPVDMDALDDIAKRHDLTMVQDSCEALGATYKGRMVGAGTGWPSVFAFYANKQMTTGEGGMLCTDDDSLAEQWRSLINQGRADSGQWLAHDRLGFNFRLSDVASAIGVAQVEKLPRILAMRQQVAAEYTRMLADVPGVTTPLTDGGGNVRSWFVYWVVLDEEIDRNDVMQQLNDRGIQCKPYLPSVHL
ncbi:MAG: Glutamine--scyllo-inositol transaminase, partial [Thermoleophilia bacterium]|nr:Glutamine--scyllo-inositol transaminase [Thermoleophilia bacterium]